MWKREESLDAVGGKLEITNPPRAGGAGEVDVIEV
jgi:hypothetical protein